MHFTFFHIHKWKSNIFQKISFSRNFSIPIINISGRKETIKKYNPIFDENINNGYNICNI